MVSENAAQLTDFLIITNPGLIKNRTENRRGDCLKEKWQRDLAEARSTRQSVLQRCSISETASVAEVALEPKFEVKIPKSFESRIRSGDPKDPLLLQVLPDSEELESVLGFAPDPVGDSQASLGEGLIKKYHGRVLVLVNGACAIHCRFCFRQNFPYDSVGSHARQIEALMRLCEQDSSIHEVILSGGDPLTAPDEVLTAWINALNQIPSVTTVRIHSRVPVVMPSRITAGFLESFGRLKAQKFMVLHINHAQEINQEVEDTIGSMRRAGFVCLSQSVLLRGINDNVEALDQLFQALCRQGVVPYYLHQLDQVIGAQRFLVDESVGIELIRQLRSRLPGYAVPRYVRETAGESSKTIIA
jgi:EF-P beta-lysylation protein EpmB